MQGIVYTQNKKDVLYCYRLWLHQLMRVSHLGHNSTVYWQ